MCNNKLQDILKWLTNVKGNVQNVYRNSYYFNCRHISIVEIHLFFWDVSLFCVVLYVAVDEWLKPHVCTLLYSIVMKLLVYIYIYIYIVTHLTAWNMDNVKCACCYGCHSFVIVMRKIFMVVKMNCGLVSYDTV